MRHRRSGSSLLLGSVFGSSGLSAWMCGTAGEPITMVALGGQDHMRHRRGGSLFRRRVWLFWYIDMGCVELQANQ